jgi:hypothetical protein
MRSSEELEGAARQREPYERFLESMKIDFDKWHDGIGYDLEALDEMSSEERISTESMIISRSPWDWRDMEALAQLDTPRSRECLRTASKGGDREVRLAVVQFGADVLTEGEITAILIEALENADLSTGLSQALDLVEDDHPKEVEDALIDGVMSRKGDVAYHFASMLLFIHGKIESPYDLSMRPFLLRFNTDDEVERSSAYEELIDMIRG